MRMRIDLLEIENSYLKLVNALFPLICASACRKNGDSSATSQQHQQQQPPPPPSSSSLDESRGNATDATRKTAPPLARKRVEFADRLFRNGERDGSAVSKMQMANEAELFDRLEEAYQVIADCRRARTRARQQFSSNFAERISTARKAQSARRRESSPQRGCRIATVSRRRRRDCAPSAPPRRSHTASRRQRRRNRATEHRALAACRQNSPLEHGADRHRRAGLRHWPQQR